MPNWKKLIVSGSDATLRSLNVSNAVTASFFTGDGSGLTNLPTSAGFPFTGSAQITGSLQVIGPTNLSGSLTASGLIYPTIDGTVNQAIVTDGAGNLSFDNPYSSNTVVYGKNLSGTTILKGTPLYFTGSGTSGNLVGVLPADAGNPARMPAAGVAGEELLTTAEGIVLLDGFINGVNTSAFSSGDPVYVAVGGGYTNVKPTGSTILIQALGYVERSAVNGSGVIQGSGRANDVPNIQQGYTWVGNADGVATPTATSSFSVANAVSSSFATTASFALFALSASSAPGFTTNHTQPTASTTWSFNHNLNTRNPLVQVYDLGYNQIIPNQIVGIDAFTVEIRFDYTQAGYAVASNGGGLYITGSTSRLVQTVADTTWSFQHNLGTKYPGFEIYNSNDDVIIPAGIHAVDEDNAEIYFAIPSTGIAIANFSGINGLSDNAVSASYAATASYSDEFYIGQTQTEYATVASSINGSNTIFNQATGSYTSAFFKYTVSKGANARSGEIMSVWNGTTVAFTDNSTTDIGSTTPVTASVIISGANVRLNMQTNTNGWKVKSIATFM
jgi:hypothetical protein